VTTPLGAVAISYSVNCAIESRPQFVPALEQLTLNWAWLKTGKPD
jgi:hypothetical protein